MPKDKQLSEQSPYFPSGKWQGFYLYSSGPDAARHRMDFTLNFRDGNITGSGSDDVGGFSWRGTYDVSTLSVHMVKQYASHTVDYQGMADTTGIYGTWSMTFMKGGFHIWPKQDNRESKEEEVAKKNKKLAIT